MLCVLMVEGMSVVVNVMLSLIRDELGFLNCYDICMCVVNKQFQLLEFVFDSVYVDLQYDEIYFTFSAGSVSLCCVCSHVVVFGVSLRLSLYPMWMR